MPRDAGGGPDPSRPHDGAEAAEPPRTSTATSLDFDADEYARENRQRVQKAAMPAAAAPADAHCYLCLEGASEGELIRGCACRGSAGFAHLACFVQSAKADATNQRWTKCPTCKQHFTGRVQIGLAEARAAEAQTGAAMDGKARAAKFDLLNAKLHAGEFAAAEALGEELLAAVRLAHGDKAMQTAEGVGIASHMSQAYGEMGKFDDAVKIIEEACSGIRADNMAFPDAVNVLASMEQNLGSIYARMGRFDLALPLAERALEFAKDATDSDAGERHVMALYSLSNLQSSIGDHVKAVAYGEESVALSTRIFGASHPLTRQAHSGLENVRKWADLPQLSEQESEEHYFRSRPRARIVGIVSKPELNGRVVAVDKLVEGSDPERYRVFVPAFEGRPKTTIDLKPTNLVLDRGVAVVAKGLTGAPELNGCVGSVLGWDDEKGRYSVRFEGRQRAAALKPGNVQCVEPEPAR